MKANQTNEIQDIPLESNLDLNQLNLYDTAVLEKEKSRISKLLGNNLSFSKPERRFLKKVKEEIEDILTKRPVDFLWINPWEEAWILDWDKELPLVEVWGKETWWNEKVDRSNDPIYKEFINSLHRWIPIVAITILEKINNEHANTYNIGEELQNNWYPFSKLLHALANKGIGNIYFESIRKIIQVFKNHISAELMEEIEKHIAEIKHLSGVDKEIRQSERGPKRFLDDTLFYTIQWSYDDDKVDIKREYSLHLGKIQTIINKLILSWK